LQWFEGDVVKIAANGRAPLVSGVIAEIRAEGLLVALEAQLPEVGAQKQFIS
jgi:hypothetical protein